MDYIVKTACGLVSGIETESAIVYKGIPYAKPPVGRLRFNNPEPCQTWQGVLKADKFPNKCVQGGHAPDSFYGKEFYSDPEWLPPSSEDCLYLNIWMPKKFESPCPVAVWIHGGGFMSGFGSEIDFDGEEYAKRGIVVVTINYRLGMLGFFCHPELTARDGRSGNYGLFDQIAAIDWVRENISFFGGDNNNITLFGQSAGGLSILSLASSPLMKGKIHKAIIQSAGGYKGFINKLVPMGKLEKVFAAFLRKEKLSLDALYELPAEDMLPLAGKFLRYAPLRTGLPINLIPVIDGYVVPKKVSESAELGKTLRIPYMLGCTKNDIMVGMLGSGNMARNRMLRSAVDWCAIHNEQGVNSYAYYFSHNLQGDKRGAFHSSELWYIFGTLDRCWRPMSETDFSISAKMIDSWASFIKSGNPGWKVCKKDNPYVEVFGE